MHTQTKSGSKYLDLGMEGDIAIQESFMQMIKRVKLFKNFDDNLSNTANINTYTHRVAIDLLSMLTMPALVEFITRSSR